MPRKNSDLGQKLSKAQREEARRASETPEQREKRLAIARLSNLKRRAAETPEQREARLASVRLRGRMRRAAETPEQREARLANARLKTRIRRAAKTPGPNTYEAQRQKAKRASETPEQREKRLAIARLSDLKRRASATPEQRLARYARDRWKAVERQRAKRAAETPEQREARLASVRLRGRMRRAAKTPLKHLAHYDPSINMDPNFDPTEFLTIKEEFLPNDVDIHAIEQAQFTQINGNLNVQMPPEAEITHDNCDQSDEMEFITPKTEVYIEGYELQEQELLQKQMQLNNKDIDHHQKHS